MKADQHRTLVDVQGFRHIGGNAYEKDGYPYLAFASDEPGMTGAELRSLGIPARAVVDAEYNCLVIKYGTYTVAGEQQAH